MFTCWPYGRLPDPLALCALPRRSRFVWADDPHPVKDGLGTGARRGDRELNDLIERDPDAVHEEDEVTYRGRDIFIHECGNDVFLDWCRRPRLVIWLFPFWEVKAAMGGDYCGNMTGALALQLCHLTRSAAAGL